LIINKFMIISRLNLFFDDLYIIFYKRAFIKLKSRSSGFSFYRELSSMLNNLNSNSKAILFNIDAQFHFIILSIFIGRYPILRIDGLQSDFYNGKNSYLKLNLFRKILFNFINIFIRNKQRVFFITLNFSEIIKILLARGYIFQSEFVRENILYHLNFTKNKKYEVIFNAKSYESKYLIKKIKEPKNCLKLLCLFDPNVARKRTDIMIIVLNKIKSNYEIDIEVDLYGFYELKKYPEWFNKIAIEIINNKPSWINFLPRYNIEDIGKSNCLMSTSDAVFTMSLFDPCPNFIVEMIALGLPIICTYSGGTKEIVGEAGICVNENNDKNKQEYIFDDKYRSVNYDLNEIEYLASKYHSAILRLKNNLNYMRQETLKWHKCKLDFSKILSEYDNFLNSI
tara:strand:- start:452 stop:1639 length:1188 start_codon:yes stop_codon:yes gene_type:complete